MKKVFVLISDKNYLEHVKSLFINAKNEGKWDGDFCLIANNINDSELVDLKNFGVEIIHKNIDNPYYAKFYLFDLCMKKWSHVMYMDCDFVIFDDLKKIIDSENNNLLVDIEPFQIHEYFCQEWDINKKELEISKLKKEFDVEKKGFNSGFLYFNTNLINQNSLKELMVLKEKWQYINNHTTPLGTEQPILNIYFNDKVSYVTKNKVCYWRKISSETIALHFCRWDAPWKNNTYSSKFGVSYFEKYNENLKKFYDIKNLRITP